VASRGRRSRTHQRDATPDAAAFAALFLGLRDTIQREGAAVLPNAELYAWVLEALARDVARQSRIPDVPYRTQASTVPVPTCGNRLDEFLARRGVTKSELARRLGLSRFGITKIAQGTRPHYDLAMAIAAALDSEVTLIFPPQLDKYGPHRKEERKRGQRSRTRSK
jgi:DNA-binding XRE family transcriptional regulator